MKAHTTHWSDDRVQGKGDWLARQFFSPANLPMSPEEYAARHAHEWGCFSSHEYSYDDPLLGAWVRRLWEILVTEGEVERCRVRIALTDQVFYPLRCGVVAFEEGRGLEELLAAWPTISKQMQEVRS